MKHKLLNLTCSALLGAVAAPAFAASTFHLVVPLAARTQAQEPVEAITVSMAGAALPKATVNQAYSESLRPYLSVTGDAAFDPAAASWRLAEGTLPEGLSLDSSTGAVAGTPTTRTTTPTSFTVLSSYKGKDGQASYTIEVGGQILEAISVATGTYHSCAITKVGALKCWGYNYYGQLGNGTKTLSTVPVQVSGMTSGVVNVSAGYHSTCAVTTAGSVKCWGMNTQGQLGDGSKTDRVVPSQVVGLTSNGVSVITSGMHSCAILDGGAVRCWGANGYGQVGDGSTTERVSPVAVPSLSKDVMGLALGQAHSCSIKTTGVVQCWGANGEGQLGDGSGLRQLSPVSISGLGTEIQSLNAYNYQTCVVTKLGAAKCWGANGSGQLGDGTITRRVTPVQVSGLTSGVKSIGLGTSHTCAVMSSGGLMCWGANGSGQLGTGNTTAQLTPVAVPALTSGVLHVAGGSMHTCATTEAGAVKCWGRNAEGELGINSTSGTSTPVEVIGIN